MNTITEYTKIDSNGIKVITKEEAFSNTTSNIYYLNGVREDKDYSKGERAKDEDVILKDSFVLDLDIRNNFDGILTNEDIIYEGTNIANTLKEYDEYFGEWSEIVFTGNGLHIIYRGAPALFTKEQYSIGVSRIYRQWDKLMGDKMWDCDKACKNIGRILRLPGSINQKNGAKVEIIATKEKESRLFNLIKAFAIKEQEELERYKKEREIEIQKQLKKFSKDDNNFYEEINMIPSYQIAQLLVPEFSLNKNEKNFDNNKGGFTGYFYNRATNSICNGGSRYFNYGNTESCYNNFSLVKNFKNWNDRDTFLFYKELLGKK